MQKRVERLEKEELELKHLRKLAEEELTKIRLEESAVEQMRMTAEQD